MDDLDQLQAELAKEIKEIKNKEKIIEINLLSNQIFSIFNKLISTLKEFPRLYSMLKGRRIQLVPNGYFIVRNGFISSNLKTKITISETPEQLKIVTNGKTTLDSIVINEINTQELRKIADELNKQESSFINKKQKELTEKRVKLQKMLDDF